MQTIDLICLGKLNARYCAEGVAEYAKRLSAFANFRIVELPEEKIEEKNASPALVARALEKEGKAILSHLRRGQSLVALCVEGKLVSSEELAIRTSAGRLLLVGSAQIAEKATRDSQGVAVVTLKKNQSITSVRPAAGIDLADPHRYRVRTLPALGALLRGEDIAEQQTME